MAVQKMVRNLSLDCFDNTVVMFLHWSKLLLGAKEKIFPRRNHHKIFLISS